MMTPLDRYEPAMTMNGRGDVQETVPDAPLVTLSLARQRGATQMHVLASMCDDGEPACAAPFFFVALQLLATYLMYNFTFPPSACFDPYQRTTTSEPGGAWLLHAAKRGGNTQLEDRRDAEREACAKARRRAANLNQD